MLKRVAIYSLLLALVATVPALAQEYRGNLRVMVSTDDGAPIVGAKCTVSGGTQKRTGETDENGRVAFIKLEPDTYTLEIEKSGFNVAVLTGVQINSNADIDLPVKLQRSEISERVEVVSRTPLLDRRKTETGAIVSPEELEKIPSARDPWAILTTIPGIQADRINVGGNQSGQQSGFVGKGDRGDNATWVMDGVEFTDLSAQGGSATYFDFNSFQEIGFATGGGDLEQLTPGQRLTFVTKQGSNQHKGTAALTLTDAGMQSSTPVVTQPDGNTAPGNQITEVFEKNFELGGPIVRDKAFYWFGFSQNDINIQQIPAAGAIGTPDRTKLQNLTGKINGNIGDATSYKLFYTRGDKIKLGRSGGPSRPTETTWDQAGPSPIYTADVSHFFNSNFEMSAQVSVVEGGFSLTPKGLGGDNGQILWDSDGVWRETFIDYATDRPIDNFTVRGNYFLETGNLNHEFKFGVKRKEGEVESISKYGRDGVVASAFFGEAGLYRGSTQASEVEYTGVWAGDTILYDNWTFNIGFNWQTQEGAQLASTNPANGLDPATLPALQFAGRDPNFEWDDFLPRLGVSYLLPTAKRILLRANYAQYADQLAFPDIAYNHVAGTSALVFDWNDLNADNLVQIGEYDPNDPIAAANIDPDNPTSTNVVDFIDPNLEAPTTTEFIIGGEIELLRDFTVGLNYTSRELEDPLWFPIADLSTRSGGGTGDTVSGILPTSAWTAQAPVTGTIQCVESGVATGSPSGGCSDLPGVGTTYSVIPFLLTDTANTTTARNSVLSNRPDYTEDFESIEITATKRLSNNWSLRAFVALQDWTRSVGSGGIQQPGNYLTQENIDGSDVVFDAGTGSGQFGDVFVGSSEWTYNINGTYQLPKNFTIGANLNGREGYVLPLFVQSDQNDALGRDRQSLAVGNNSTYRLDDLHVVDLKLGYLLALDSGVNVDLSIDMFNVFDEDTTLQVERQLGRVVGSGANTGVSGTAGRIDELLSPRVWRLGARITF